MLRSTLERGIAPPLLSSWRSAAERFGGLLGSLGVTEETQTTEILLRQVPIESPQRFSTDLATATAEDDAYWLYFTLSDGKSRAALALPVAKRLSPASASLGLYVEIHSRLIAWWLTYAWRTSQLHAAAGDLASADQAIPAASCARALLETAAAFWVDTRKFAEIWAAAKAAGKPTMDAPTVAIRQAFVNHLNEVQFGGKFNDKAPKAGEVFGHYPRGNVLTAIEKLAKRFPGDLQTDYQWLCNTVHPSLGTALVFSAPPLRHETGTHVQRWFAGVPLRIESLTSDPFDEKQFVDQSVFASTARACIAALQVLTESMDAALRVVDDIGLTSGAPALADFAYWRALAPGARNLPCPLPLGSESQELHSRVGQTDPRGSRDVRGRRRVGRLIREILRWQG